MFNLQPSPALSTLAGTSKFLLWIDRVGVFLVCMTDQVTIGGPGIEGDLPDIGLMAPLSRKHATLIRSGESYVVQPHAAVHLGHKPLHDRAEIYDGNELRLGAGVRLRFRLPTVMSGSARLEFLSDHRPRQVVDGIVLMDDTCLLGPQDDHHIACPSFTAPVLLYRKQGEIWCKSRNELFVNGQFQPGGAAIPPGAIVEGSDMRFRLESLSK